jgi:hypothetical protein
MITVESTETAIRVTIPKDDIPPDQVNKFLEWLRFESLARQSKLTEADANRLADEIKTSWWSANKSRFIDPSQQ